MNTPTSQITGLFNHPIAFKSLMDEIPLGVTVLDTKRRIILLNRSMEGLTGFVQQDVEGIPCQCVLRCNICIESCPAQTLREETDTKCMEGNIINRDRQKIPVRITFSPIRNTGGTTIGFMEVVEDIRFIKELDAKMGQAFGFGHLIGASPQMEKIFRVLPVIAQSDSSVLITGETGAGKDFVAEAIHQASPRVRDPFIKVNCGALPETLLESELFGHQKGAFTGAFENKPGRFRLAHNGTLYLTEIGDLPLSLQVKLLTFLDDKVVHPLGSTKGFHVNVRVIAATHRNLEKMVHEDRFREDLLFRLNVVRLHLPPLRSRGDDVRLLLDHFLNTFITEFKKPIKGFSAKALRILLDYAYPGNVRELRNIVEYAINVCQEDLIQWKHLPSYVTDVRTREEREREKSEEQLVAFPAHIEAKTAKEPGAEERAGDLDVDWATVEKRMIMEAMIKAKGRRSKAAALLGWGRSTLWRKMKQYGLAL